MIRAVALSVLLLGGCGRAGPRGSALDDVECRAAAWLYRQQRSDGSWRSETYGLLKPGQSLTPFVLVSLMGTLSARDQHAVARADGFIREMTAPDGSLGTTDLTAHDYPVYATSLALRYEGWVRSSIPSGAGAPFRITDLRERWLRGQQFTEANGWKREDPAFGGWGMGGPIREVPHPGHLDISKTRYALEALRAAGAKDEDPAFERARVFLGRCQDWAEQGQGQGTGGFWFSPVILDANKAGKEGDRFRPYGTTTADGILALLACGVKPDEPRLAAGHRWLREHHRTDVVPGIPPGVSPYWETAMRFYYLAGCSAVFARLGGPEGWREALTAALAASQKSDGSFQAENPMMREDDPLIATALALQALAPIR